MGLGHVTCKGGPPFFVDHHCLTFPPTHPRVFQLFISLQNNFKFHFIFDSWQVHVLTFHVYSYYYIIVIVSQACGQVASLTWFPGVCEKLSLLFCIYSLTTSFSLKNVKYLHVLYKGFKLKYTLQVTYSDGTQGNG